MLTLPTPSLEAWKYTNLARAHALLPEGPGHTPSLRELEALLPIFAAPQVVFQHGKPVPELGTPLPNGVALQPLGACLCGPKVAPLDALDTLAVAHGWRLEITASPALPVVVIHAAGGPPTSLEIVVAAGCVATVIEAHIAWPGTPGWQHHGAVVQVSEAAALTHSVLVLLPDEAQRLHTRRQYGTLAPHAQYHGTLLSVGGGLLRQELHTTLSTQCDYSLVSLSCARAAQHHDVTLQTHHTGVGNRVNIRQRNVQMDESHAVFQGKFKVAAEAQQTDAYMHCHTLLLSDTARTSTKPELEIYADDVKCSHGAASGGLQPAQLFYLQARGLPVAAAQALLVEGFTESFLAEFPPHTQRVARQRVAQWLQGGSNQLPALTDFSDEWLANTKANPEQREILRAYGDTLERPHYEVKP